MTPSGFAAELLRPFRDTTVLIGMLVFIGLGMLIVAAGTLFGLWLAIVVVPAFTRFLIRVLQARIDGRAVEPAGIELFSLVDSIWTFLPLVLIAGGWLVVAELSTLASPALGGLVAIGLLIALPASLGVLGLTQSPAAALNPILLAKLVERCGPAYFAVPAAVVVVAGAALLMAWSGVPLLVVQVAEIYALFLLFSMTGAVVAGSGLREEVGIAEPVPPDPDKARQTADRERRACLDHSYGLFSRGNSQGGLAHLVAFIDKFDDVRERSEEFKWFFWRMTSWESVDPSLMLAQRYLGTLAAAGDTGAVLKVLNRCFSVAPGFRILPEDSERVEAILCAAGREDLSNRLAGLEKSG